MGSRLQVLSTKIDISEEMVLYPRCVQGYASTNKGPAGTGSFV